MKRIAAIVALAAVAGFYFKDSGARLGGSVISGNAARIAVHRKTVVRQNHPDDRFSK
jgi:hypothetical protein